MRSTDLTAFLASTISARLPVLVIGPPGVGKTALVEQAAESAGYDMIISHPVVSDPTDFKGLPWPDAEKGVANFLPFGELSKAIHAKRDTIWLIDDLGQSSPGVQAAVMQLLLARRLEGHILSDKIVFVCCSNRRQDKAGVQGILEPVKSRFAAIVELEAHIDDWSQWAFSTDFVPAEMVAFLRNRPELLHKFEATSDISNTPSPRTWANLAKLQKLNLPKHLQYTAFKGAVGEGAATEYVAFLEMVASMVSIDQILLDPQGAPIPQKPGELYAVAAGLAYRADQGTFGRVAQYCQRLVGNGQAEFGVLTIKDSLKRIPDLAKTREYIELTCGPMGKILLGAVR